MKNFLIRLLFKLIDLPKDSNEKDHLIQEWMAESWQHPGFAAYMKQRDREFVKVLSGGLGAQALTRESYVRYLGQRVELQRFGKKVQHAFIQQQKKKKGKK